MHTLELNDGKQLQISEEAGVYMAAHIQQTLMQTKQGGPSAPNGQEGEEPKRAVDDFEVNQT